MTEGAIIQVSAYPGWIVGVCRDAIDGYYCWVIDPNYELLSDGRIYETSNAAMLAGRSFVESRL